jgi:hypothetical protein
LIQARSSVFWEAMMGVGLCGDIRVSRRFERILEDITKSGSLVVRKLGADRAAEMGAHRFLGSERVTPQAILEEAAERTARACRGLRVVVAQDTTEINFSGRDNGRRGLGLGGDGRSLGFFVHPLVATPTMKRCWVWRERRFGRARSPS